MLSSPIEFASLIIAFAPLFSERVWQYVPVLVTGAVLAPGKRTVTSILQVMGLSSENHFQNYHRVLNRARWSSQEASRLLLDLLIAAFAPCGVLVMGLDDTLERRRGKRIKAKGIYRDPVRSSHSHVVKASALRWVSLMLLVPIPWAKRVWGLPFLTVLAPSERYHQAQGRRHKRLTDWGRQMLLQVRHWLPERELVVVADSSFAVLDFLARLAQPACPIACVTRLRLDAALYEPAPPRRPKQNGRPRRKGARLATLQQVLADRETTWQTVLVKGWYAKALRRVEITSATAVWYHTGLPSVPIRWVLVRDPIGQFQPQAFLCTQLEVNPVQVLEWFVMRWPMEVTFEEARAHLGVETQRQWADKAIARTTPALFALYSIITLLAQRLITTKVPPVRTAAWYAKEQATFSDTIALVRWRLWRQPPFSMSTTKQEVVKIPRSLFERLTDALCYAA